ncbi:MAG: putative dehydrogenase [Cellvibrionaceae bacterium]|jgi:predicted dehydrogenase
MTLTVLVYGSGFAGKGHVQAFRTAGCEVVGMVGRTAHVVEQVAAEMGIPYAGIDWEAALDELKPDIVSIGTPGGAHFEPIMAAFAKGCHVFCDKPLAETAERAKALYQTGEAAGVKTAYAACYRYMPNVLLAKRLVAEGKIGEPLEAECISHFNLDPLIPFGWSHRLDTGGGRLNNNFTHKLSIVESVLDMTVSRVCGTTRNDMPFAPIVSGVHDFRERRKFVPKSADDPGLEWGAADVEWSYSVLAQMDNPQFKQPVSATFQHSGLQPRFQPDYIAFYGDKGSIYIEGHYGKGPLYFYDQSDRSLGWQTIPLPEDIIETLPNIEDDTLRNWTILACKFVNHIGSKGAVDYQTFRDGAIYQQVIDAVRGEQSWKAVLSPS